MSQAEETWKLKEKHWIEIAEKDWIIVDLWNTVEES